MEQNRAMTSRWWKCAAVTCPTNAATDTSPLVIKELPATPMAPLFIVCGNSSCSLRMVPCECCQSLVDANKEVDGVLLCRRCGFLTVLDPALRTLLQIAPFNRSILNHIPVFVSEILALRHQIVAFNSDHPHNVDADNHVVSQWLGEHHKLQRQLHELVGQWEQLKHEAGQAFTSPTHQTFSSTHLNILRIMYETSSDQAELIKVVELANQFLLDQSTLLKMKYDILAALQICAHVDQLKSPVFQPSVSLNVLQLITNCTKDRVKHQYKAYQALCRQYLPLVGIANKHLFALFNAAQSLHRMRQSENHSINGHGHQLLSDHQPIDAAAFNVNDHIRKRRRFSGSNFTKSGNNSHSSMGDAQVSRMQQTIEFGNRVTEVSKKVDLWRSLSATIASVCILNVIELATAMEKNV